MSLVSKPTLFLITNCIKRQVILHFSTSKMNSSDCDLLVRQIAPVLTSNKHKGQDGRIGVFGGSLEYTGAPYFGAISALKVGADLAHVFCSEAAAPVIKSYSPELIVHPLLNSVADSAAKIEPWLDRLHVILIGPGLGRDPSTLQIVTQVIEMCKKRNKPLVIDADGLYLITENPNILHNYPAHVILTPNMIEFSRLIGGESGVNKRKSAKKILELAPFITILCKGQQDEMFDSRNILMVQGGGSGRRCGGQGDILAGSLTTFLTWALGNKKFATGPALISCYAACKLVRACNQKAFVKWGRSMTASDMITEIHEVFKENFEIE